MTTPPPNGRAALDRDADLATEALEAIDCAGRSRQVALHADRDAEPAGDVGLDRLCGALVARPVIEAGTALLDLDVRPRREVRRQDERQLVVGELSRLHPDPRRPRRR